MTISSRTPEGMPNRCPICGSRVIIEPSAETCDAPCPRCGQLLWWFQERAGTTRVGRISADTRWINLLRSADSLDAVELVMELEEEFDVTLSDEDAQKIATVGDAIRYIQRKRRESGEE